MPTCFYAIVTKNEIRDRLRDLKTAKKLGILRPEVKLGDIVEAGSGRMAFGRCFALPSRRDRVKLACGDAIQKAICADSPQ